MWEYRCIKAEGGAAEANALGREGWEMVGAVETVLWFKRPIRVADLTADLTAEIERKNLHPGDKARGG